MEIQCEFETKGPSRYVCAIHKVVITHRCRVKSFIGIHEAEKSNKNVTYLEFVSSTVHYLPEGLHEIFPQLKVLSVQECKLKEITSNNLLGLENLEELRLGSNNLTSLPDDLFVHTKKLKEVGFYNNQLEFMSSRLFNSIPDGQWEFVNFEGNKKINLRHWPNYPYSISLNKLKSAIDAFCSPPATQFTVLTKITTNGFEKIWELKKFSDFAIAVELMEIKVHKVVLAVQSPVFASMFENDDQVKAANKLEIKDCSVEAVEEFLCSLYTGEVKDATNALELFGLACTFDVDELKSVYEKIVIENLNEENAVRALKLGNLHESDGIIEAAFTMIDSTLPEKLNDNLKRQPEKVEKIVNMMKLCKETFESLNI